MMNLQQSLSEDIRCEIPNHFLDKVQYVCVFQNCSAEQRLCCSYCKFRFHNQHIQSLVKISDFTNKVQKDGLMLNVQLQEKGKNSQLDQLYWQKIDKKIKDEIHYANMQLQGVFSNINAEVQGQIHQMNHQIDEKALGQSVFDLQTKVQRIINRPWSHQSNQAIDLMAKIYRGDKYGELLEDEYFISHRNIQTINNYFTSVHIKLEAFFKNIMEQIPLIFNESFKNTNDNPNELLNIRRKEKDQTYPSIRTSSMRREQKEVDGYNIYDPNIGNSRRNLIPTDINKSRQELDSQNNTIDLERQRNLDQASYNNQQQQRPARSMQNIMNNGQNSKPQSVLFRQHDQSQDRKNNHHGDSLDQYAIQMQNNNQNSYSSNQGYYPFGQQDMFSDSQDPYIRYSKQLQQRKGNSLHYSNEAGKDTQYQRQNHHHNQNHNGEQYQVIQNDQFIENDIQYSNQPFKKQQKQQYSAVSIKTKKQLMRNMAIQNRFSKQDLAKMRLNFAQFIIENNNIKSINKGDQETRTLQPINNEAALYRKTLSKAEIDKKFSHSLEDIHEQNGDNQSSQVIQERQRTTSLILINQSRKNNLSLIPLQPVPELHDTKSIKNKQKSTSSLPKKLKKKLQPYLHPTIYYESPKRETKNVINNSCIIHTNSNNSPAQNSLNSFRQCNYCQNILNQKQNQGYQVPKSLNQIDDYQENSHSNFNNQYENSSPDRSEKRNNQSVNDSLNHLQFDSPSKNKIERSQNNQMSIILPSDANKDYVPQGSKIYLPSETQLEKQESHLRQPPQQKNFDHCKLPVQSAPYDLIQKPLETDQKNIKNNQPQKDWIAQKSLPENFAQKNKLKDIQAKYGFVKLPDTNQSQSRLGLMKSAKGEKYYEGEWLKGKRHGKGTFYDEDGSIYEGEWKEDQMTGKGRLILKDGQQYEGDLINGIFDGKGYLKYPNGQDYIGEFKQGRLEGEGRKNWNNGAYYEGQFFNNQREGFGIFMWKNGSFYQGNFKNNQFNGNGFYQWQSGRLYEGEWVDGKMEGKGRDISDQGHVYEGQFKNDLKNGYGVYVVSENKIYKGNWLDDKPHGEGAMIEKGVEKKGIWEHGVKKN
ncbi:hypothetical protein ABPG74_004132 [Tetrahymena malaccensis]